MPLRDSIISNGSNENKTLKSPIFGDRFDFMSWLLQNQALKKRINEHTGSDISLIMRIL